MEHQSIVKLDQASRMLAEIHSVDDARGIVDLAEAARVYARQVGLGLEAQNHAAEVKLRAQRRGGEILQQMEKNGGAKVPRATSSQAASALPKIEDLGITYSDSSRWQNIAKMPAEKFEEFITETKESGGEITTAAALKIASGQPHVSHNSGENEWYTPAEYVNAARELLGEIDLDPASSGAANKVVGATKYYSVEDDGLKHEWTGRVWLNPPYASHLIGRFTSKLTQHYLRDDIREALVLVNNATETSWFQDMAIHAVSICFLRSRVRFWGPNGQVGAPLQGQSVLYFGENRKAFESKFESFGLVLWR